MKKLFVVILYIILVKISIFPCYAQTKNKINTPWYLTVLKGKVKTHETVSYNLQEKFGVLQKSISRKSLTTYNDNGIKLKEVFYSADNSFLYENIYKYDDKGNLIESVEPTSYIRLFKYDDKNKLIEEASYKRDGSLVNKYIYKYDDKNNLIEMSEYNSVGSLERKAFYTYDDKGYIMESADYWGNGKPVITINYKNDDKGNPLEKIAYYPNSSLFKKYIYKYDNNGNQIEEASYWDDGMLFMKIIYKYDNYGNQIEEEIYNLKNKFGENVETLISLESSTYTYFD